jgi:nucleotide-binding universal stress UspA family protein
MLSIKTILYPTDFSPRAEYAFHLACALARDYDAQLLIAYVEPPTAAIYGELGALPPEPLESEELLRRRLLNVRPTDKHISCQHYFLVGETAEEIIRLAEERHADMIVMGTHGRRGLGRLLMGSVAEQVVRKAGCPVVTVKAPIAETAPTAEHVAGAAV